jgi:hypothetical protein
VTDIVYGVRITGDAADAKKAFDETRGAQDKLTGAEKENARAAQDVERANKRKEDSLNRLRLGILAAGAATLVFMRSSVNEAINAEREQNRLEAVLRATGGAAGFAREHYDQLADSLAALTQFEAGNITDAQAELVKFGNIHGQVFEDALRLSTDLAAFMGTNVPQAAQMVGRALQSPTEGMRLLEREFGRLTDAERKHIDSLVEQGRAVEAQNAVLELLQGKIGGTAELMNTGLTRATSGVTKAWKDMLEAFARAPAVQEKTESALGFVEQSLKDIREIIEGGDWVEKTLAILAFAGGWRDLKLSRPASETGLAEAEAFEAGLRPAPVVTLGGDTEAARKREQEAAEREKARVQRAAEILQARQQALSNEERISQEGNAARIERTDALEKEAEAVRQAIDPWHAYRVELEQLQKLRDEGFLTEADFVEAVGQAANRAAGDMEDLGRAGTETFEGLKAAVDDFGRELARSLASGEAGFRSLTDVASRFLEELLAIQLEKRLIAPALQAGTSFIDELFASSTPGAYTGNAAPFHGGGIVGLEGGARRSVHPGYFERAPRLHSGLMPDEFPAVLQRGEGVFTPGQMRAMGGGNVTIKVINETGVPVQGQASAPRVDASGMAVDLVLRRLAVDGGARQQLRGMLTKPEH